MSAIVYEFIMVKWKMENTVKEFSIHNNIDHM